jgi:ABC-2 type transport system permease protein
MNTVRLWRILVAARVRAQLQYRTSLTLDLLSSFIVTFLDFVAMLALFTHLHALGSWTIGEVAFLYGTGGLGFALADLLVGHIEDTHRLIRTGQFDVLLVRPAGTLTQVIASDLSVRRLGKVAQAAVVFGYALTRTHIRWNAGRLAMTAMIMICGAAIFCAIFVLGACITFWTVGSAEAANAFTYGGNLFTQYPLDVFGPWLRRVLAYAVPTAFVTYFPSLYVLDKPDPAFALHWMRYASPFVSVALAGTAVFTWRIAVRHYRSTGS